MTSFSSTSSHSSKKILLMRHAESLHNLAKKKMEQECPNYKDTKQYRSIKLDKRFIDPKEIVPLSNLNQTLLGKNAQKITLIVSSPLRRCLQTAKHVKQYISSLECPTPPVIVEPYLSSRFCTAWSIGSEIEQLIAQYSDFDFNFCHFSETEYWGKQFLSSTNKDFLAQRSRTNNKSLNQEQLLRMFAQGKVQSYGLMKERIQNLKIRINTYLSLLKNDQSMLIISHSCLMSALCSKQFDENGKTTKKLKFQHVKPIQTNEKFQIPQELMNKLIKKQKKVKKIQPKF